MARVTQIARHRNGVAGDPFYVALVQDDDAGSLVVIVPASAVESGQASEETGLYQSYAINPALAASGVIEFGANSWRGDNYFDLVVAAARDMT